MSTFRFMKARITKELFYRNGGLANPLQFRKQVGGAWSYWITYR